MLRGILCTSPQRRKALRENDKAASSHAEEYSSQTEYTKAKDFVANINFDFFFSSSDLGEDVIADLKNIQDYITSHRDYTMDDLCDLVEPAKTRVNANHATKYVNKTHNIDRVEFAYSSGTTVSKEVSEFSLTFYREEQTKTNIIESPTANAAAIAKNEFLVVNYMFLCANEKAKDNFNVSFEIPEKIETMVGTSLLEIEEDKEMTKTELHPIC